MYLDVNGAEHVCCDLGCSDCTFLSPSVPVAMVRVVNREQFSEVGRTNIEKGQKDTRTKKKESKGKQIGRHR